MPFNPRLEGVIIDPLVRVRDLEALAPFSNVLGKLTLSLDLHVPSRRRLGGFPFPLSLLRKIQDVSPNCF